MKFLPLIFALFCASPFTWAQNRSNFMAPGAPLFPDSPFQIHHVSNLGLGDTVITLINTNPWAAQTEPTPIGQVPRGEGQLCANLYAFSEDAKLISCCSCNVPGNVMHAISAKQDLALISLNPTIPDSIVVKMAVTEGGAHCKASNSEKITGAAFLAQADPATDPFQGRTGLVAWARDFRSGKSSSPDSGNAPFANRIEFFVSTSVGAAEIDRMSGMCALAHRSSSPFGICKSCKLGGFGASAQ